METLSISNFRSSLAASFDRADKGEKVLIRRGRQMYALVSIGQEDLTISPALQKRIDDARKSYRNGESIVLGSPAEIDDYFEAL